MIFLLPQLVDKAAERFPEREAVRFYNLSVSYAALAHQSNSLARLLVEQGVKRGDRVGIYMNKSLESVVAIYGIMKAGTAFVPLDPLVPVTRLTYIIHDCGIRHLITQEAKRDTLKQILAAKTDLECLIGIQPQMDLPIRSISWDEVYDTPSEGMPDVGMTEQDLAYILYTSGSTGEPKGIMHTHRSGLSFVEWAAQMYSLHYEDRLSNHAPLYFDLSMFDFFAGALAGAATVIIPEEFKKLPASLSKLIAAEKISVWYSVPFALIQLLLRGVLDNRDLSLLRWVLFAGEPFPTKYLRQLMNLLPHARFSNLYGPTETNVCTYYHVPTLTDNSDEPIPIGRVCANVESLVVDNDNQPVAPGEVGELLIRGPLLMRGYWRRPDLNEQVFFRRPVFTDYADVFYRTGDLVQLQPDGNFKFLGRRDRQIKIRGYRVELDDIEVALLSHEQVEEAAVFPIPDGEGSNQIEAAVTVKEGAVITSSDLAKHLTKQLPWYAVPNRIVIVEELPRTSTGKINRRELQAQALADAGIDA
ncbi:amino acid adenylation domain-containing protein [bacterium]|nr:amino acid adenylation domain-containing protein [bacterium]